MKKTLVPSKTAALTGTTLLICSLLATSCAPKLSGAPEELPPFSRSLVQCARWMNGSFEQDGSSRDSDIGAMELNQARIWDERTDGIWLYSELLDGSGREDRVIHQLIYHVRDAPSGGIMIDPFMIPGDSIGFTGAWKTPELFDRVDAFTLEPEAGCSMRLRRLPGGAFEGGTVGENCRTRRGSATRMRESFRIGSLEILYQMEGFDTEGRTVVGSSEPMVFTRKNATEDPRTIKPGTDQPTDLKMYNMDSSSE